MHMRRFLALVTAVVVLGGCAVGIPELNQRPTKYYEQSVSFRARVSRVQVLPGETLIELADAHEHRIFARVEGTVDVHPDDWVKVTGILVPETRIGGKIVYDVVRADSVTPASPPWFRNLF